MALSVYIHCTGMLLFRYWWYCGPLMRCDHTLGMIQRPWVLPEKAISCAATQVKPWCYHQGSRDCSQLKFSWALNLQSSQLFMWTKLPCKGKVYELYHKTRSSNRSFEADLGLKGRTNKEEPNPNHLLSLPFQKHLTHLGIAHHVQNRMTACTPLVASTAQPSDLSVVTPGSTVHWHIFRSALQLGFFLFFKQINRTSKDIQCLKRIHLISKRYL